MSPPLRTSIQELFEYSREREWLAAGVPPADVRFSAFCGMDARDVRTFREFSGRQWLIVIRCPRAVARPWHGVLVPKPLAVKTKSSPVTGTIVQKGHTMHVSDYDLMSVWRREGVRWRKVFISAAGGRARGAYPAEALKFLLALNVLLVSRLQHGCQDDYHSPLNPDVKETDHFAAFLDGSARYLADPAECSRFYGDQGLEWPYDAKTGKYTGPVA